MVTRQAAKASQGCESVISRDQADKHGVVLRQLIGVCALCWAIIFRTKNRNFPDAKSINAVGERSGAQRRVAATHRPAKDGRALRLTAPHEIRPAANGAGRMPQCGAALGVLSQWLAAAFFRAEFVSGIAIRLRPSPQRFNHQSTHQWQAPGRSKERGWWGVYGFLEHSRHHGR
jgi:hypothetical protein